MASSPTRLREYIAIFSRCPLAILVEDEIGQFLDPPERSAQI